MALEVRPSDVSTFPGGRIVFQVLRDGDPLDLSTLESAGVRVSFPDHSIVPGIIQPDGSFVITVPDARGTFEDVTVVVDWPNDSDTGYINVTIANVGAAPVTLTTNPILSLTPPVNAQVYDPTGLLVASIPMTADDSNNYSAQLEPDPEWKDGEYTIVIRDAEREKDVMYQTFRRPNLASAPTFWKLSEPVQVWLQYLKYDWMGDAAPTPPAAWLTIEQYAQHWVATVEELNHVPPYTYYSGYGAPFSWNQTVLKGTALKAFDFLANRGVSVPRFSASPIVMQDESHLQSAWEQRRNILKPEYDKEKIRLKGHHLPRPKITVDPMLGWVGGSLSGTARLSLLGRPSWFVRAWTGR